MRGAMAVENFTPDAVPSAGPLHVTVASGSRMYFFSGLVGRRADGTPAGDTVRAQFAQLIRNLVAVADAVGVRLDQLARTTIYVKDWRPELMDEIFAAAGDVAATEEGVELPPLTASTLVGVAALYEPWCLIEMDAIAVAD